KVTVSPLLYAARVVPVSFPSRRCSTLWLRSTCFPLKTALGNGPDSVTTLSPPIVITRTGCVPLGSVIVHPLFVGVIVRPTVVSTESLVIDRVAPVHSPATSAAVMLGGAGVVAAAGAAAGAAAAAAACVSGFCSDFAHATTSRAPARM